MKTFAFVLTMALLGVGLASADDRGNQIAQKYFALKKADDSSSLGTMTLVDKNGGQKIRKMEMFSKEGPEGTDAFTNFLEPADVSGTKFLTLTHKGKDDEQRLYLPALKKTRKISSSSKDGEFVNSDFFYYDMEERFIEDNTYKFLSEGEILADPAFAGMKFFKLEMTPVAKNAPYGRVVAWINQDNFAAYQMECYDKSDGALWKTIQALKVVTVDGVLVSTKTVVKNQKKGSSTVLELTDLKVNKGVKADVFSVKNLEK